MRLPSKIIACLFALTGFVFAGPSSSALPPAQPRIIQPQEGISARPLEAVDLEAWTDGFFPNALQQADIAGAVLVVVKDGRILFQKGYGYADVARKIPMRPDRTLVRVGSVSKTFVWTAVMQLVEQGKLDLDRDINAYLDFKIPATYAEPITLRHLMTHSSGLNERDFKEVPEGEMPRDLRAYIRGTPVPARINPPGKVSAYSNYGSMLAGYIVERASGEPFVSYIERHILKPLAMDRSTFRRPPPEHLKADISRDYGLGSEEPMTVDNEEPAGDPSGHLTTTATDISSFMLAHLQQGGVLIKPETARLMHKLAFKPPPIVKGMTLGFFRMDRNGHRIIGHPGDIVGSHADLELLLDDNVGFFLGMNSNGKDVGVLNSANLLRSSFAHRFMNRYFPAPPAAAQPTTSTAREHAQLAAGEYRLSQRAAGDFREAIWLLAQYFALDLGIKANEDGTIETPEFMAFEDGRPQTWREVAPFVWHEVGGGEDAQLNMRVEEGKVVAFATSDVLAAFEFQRVPFWKSATLNVPLLLIAIIILVLAVLMWPVAALVRRHYGQALKLPPNEARSDRATKIAALVALAYLAAWIFAMGGTSSVGFEPWIRLVQAIGLLCVAGAAVAIWNAWLTLKSNRSWWTKIGSVLVALALLEIDYFSFAFKLISASLNY